MDGNPDSNPNLDLNLNPTLILTLTLALTLTLTLPLPPTHRVMLYLQVHGSFVEVIDRSKAVGHFT